MSDLLEHQLRNALRDRGRAQRAAGRATASSRLSPAHPSAYPPPSARRYRDHRSDRCRGDCVARDEYDDRVRWLDGDPDDAPAGTGRDRRGAMRLGAWQAGADRHTWPVHRRALRQHSAQHDSGLLERTPGTDDTGGPQSPVGTAGIQFAGSYSGFDSADIRVIIARVGTSVRSVTMQRTHSQPVQATISHGWALAWWPGGAPPP